MEEICIQKIVTLRADSSSASNSSALIMLTSSMISTYAQMAALSVPHPTCSTQLGF